MKAYLETEYHVFASSPFVLKIGQQSPHLSALHVQHQSTSSAFITAWNPYSQPSCTETNQQRQLRLLKESQEKGFTIYQGEGKHPSGEWEGEQSLLLLGISLDEAKAIGEKWEQNAILWSDADCIPQLVLLR